MASLESIAETAWRNVFRNPTDETPVTKEEFIETAKVSYAYNLLLQYWTERRAEGYYSIPSILSREIEKEVVNNEIDISDLKVARSLPSDIWLQGINTFSCGCDYVKSTVNTTQLLCDDDSLGDMRTFIIIGNKIKFPKGAHSKNLPIVYASNGIDLDGTLEIDESLGEAVRIRLEQIYGQPKPIDNTNNTNPVA